jgi:hypothetical protein
MSADESMRLLFRQARKTVAEAGVAAVATEIDRDPMGWFRFIGSIAASQDTPMFFVAKGQTFRCRRQFGAG